MRTIVTAITAAALALSLTFQAVPANAAVAGYDSSYAGESAFLSLDQGDTGSFTVFFANTGTTTWTTGSATQVDLAACLEDKVTCDQQDTDEADFNDGWLSATRYATHTQTSVAPGQIGTFTYDVTVPADAAEDTFRFNGALVLASTGADIHNEGYYQDVTTGVPATEGAATLTELDPDTGDVEGGDSVTITGTDFDCTPSFPTVMFGTNEATVEACGAETLTVTTPAGDATGDVDVTVTNTGADASNALTFTYEDVTGPTFDSITVEGQNLTLNFNEPVCTDTGTLVEQTDLRVRVNGTDVDEDDIAFADCQDDDPDAAATLVVLDEIAEGDTVAVTITSTGAGKVEDAEGNTMDNATTRSATAEADVTRPTAESAAVTAANTIRVTFSEPVYCAEGEVAGSFSFDETGSAAAQTPTDSDCGDAGEADTTAGDDTTITLTFASGISQGDDGVLTYTRNSADDITDLSGNTVNTFEIDVTALEADPPLIDDAALTTNGTGGFAASADSGDVFELDFSEDMTNPTTSSTIRVQDEDGTIADIRCTGAPTSNNVLDATCTEDADDDTIWVVTLLETPDPTTDTSGDATDELVAKGDTTGLQWPATIIDTSSVEDDEGNDVDLANSADVVIDDE